MNKKVEILNKVIYIYLGANAFTVEINVCFTWNGLVNIVPQMK